MRRSTARAGALLFLTAFIALLATRGLYAQPEAPPALQVVRVSFASPEELQSLAAALDVWDVEREEGTLVALVTPEEREWLEAQGYELAVDEALSASLDLAAVADYPCYRPMDEVYADLERLAIDHADIVQAYSIGYSYEGRPLVVARLANRATPGDKPVLFVMGGIHGRELITVEVVVASAEDLASRYGLDPDVTWILDHHEVHLLVSANPDGHVRNETSASYWRKNTHPYGACTYYGVDLNRNHTFKWDACDGCSSSHPCDWSYRGPAPGCEPETRAVEGYVRALFADRRGPADDDPAPLTTSGAFLTLHAYGNEVMWPWGWTSTPPPNADGLAALAGKLARYNGYSAIPSWQPYFTDGTSDDWAYGTLGVAALTFEIGSSSDGMYPPCSRYSALVQPNLDALLYAARAARAPYLQPYGPDALTPRVAPPTVRAGEPATLTAVLNDSAAGGQAIAAGEYAVAVPWWDGGEASPMVAADGALDATVEEVGATIDTAGRAPGRHTIWVRGRDAAGNWGPPAATWVTVQANAALEGRITAAGGGEALADARVWLSGEAAAIEAPVSLDGRYRVTLSSGVYTLTAEAWGYARGAIEGLSVAPGMTATADLALQPVSLGVLAGRVRDAESGEGVSAVVAAAETPVTATTAANGEFLMALPTGTYTVSAAAAGRAPGAAADVAVAAGRTTVRDIDLTPRPPLLVVDDDYAGDWLRFDREAWHLEALDALGVAYDAWSVRERGAPLGEDLAPYGALLWLTGDARYDTLTAREQDALRGYLNGGGALLLSGQHVARDIVADPGSFLGSMLGAAYVGTASAGEVAGLGPLEGLTVTLGGGDGADNAFAPGALEAAEGGIVAARHADGRAVAVAVEHTGYRALLLGFGVESIATADGREGLLRAALAWLGAPVMADGLALRMQGPDGPVAPGDAVSYGLTLTNATGVSHTGIVITAAVPSELVVASAAPAATLSDGVIRWEGLVLAPGGALKARFTAHLRDGATPEAVLQAESYGATSDQGPARRLSGPVRTWVAPAYAVSLSAPTTPAIGWRGETAVVRIALANRGLAADTYTLMVAGGPWSAVLPVTRVTLGPGERVALRMHVAVPNEATPGETGVYVVRVESIAIGEVDDRAVVAVRADRAEGRAWLPVASRR